MWPLKRMKINFLRNCCCLSLFSTPCSTGAVLDLLFFFRPTPGISASGGQYRQQALSGVESSLRVQKASSTDTMLSAIYWIFVN